MDRVRGFESDRIDLDDSDPVPADDGVVADTQIEVGTDERRMHVRAYNHWVSLLGGRAYPSIADLDPANIADFGPHSVLLDFSAGIENPAIAYLGKAVREECSLDTATTHIAQVPSRSLLSRLTDHYLQIIANRAPIGFEAEFVSTRGFNTMYRGILMPFSSDEDSIDFIYGVINWKELVDAETQAKLDAEIAAAVRNAPPSVATAPVWADGPSGGFEAEHAEDGAAAQDDDPVAPAGTSLREQLAVAQNSAAAVRVADTRSRATLYRALSRAHVFAAAADADPEAYETLLAVAGIAVQLRAPMTPIVKLVFGGRSRQGAADRICRRARLCAPRWCRDGQATGFSRYIRWRDQGRGQGRAARAGRRSKPPNPTGSPCLPNGRRSPVSRWKPHRRTASMSCCSPVRAMGRCSISSRRWRMTAR